MPDSPLPYRISRSELEMLLDCAYSHFLHSLTSGPQDGDPLGETPSGVSRFFRKASLMIGSGLHAGFAALLEGASESPAVAHALSTMGGVAGEVKISPDHEGRELSDFEYAEAKALVEALTRLAARKVIPALLSQYNILSCEEEGVRDLFEDEPAMAGRTEFPARADAILEDRASGAVGVLSIKTSKYIEIPGSRTSTGRLIHDTQRIDMQGISELWTFKKTYPTASFVQFVTLRKGDVKLHDTKELKQAGIEPFNYYNLPLITGWKQASGLGGDDYAWAWDYWKEDESGKRSKSSLSWVKWKRFWPFLPGEPGIRVWMDLLERDDGAVIPSSLTSISGKSALDDMYQYGMPVYRTAEEEVEWLVQTRSIVLRLLSAIGKGIHKLDPDNRDDRLRILEEFPRNRQRCVYPARCEYYSHCHEGANIVDKFLTNPEEMRFVPRKDNHPRFAPASPGNGLEAGVGSPSKARAQSRWEQTENPGLLVFPTPPAESPATPIFKRCTSCGKNVPASGPELCDFCQVW